MVNFGSSVTGRSISAFDTRSAKGLTAAIPTSLLYCAMARLVGGSDRCISASDTRSAKSLTAAILTIVLKCVEGHVE